MKTIKLYLSYMPVSREQKAEIVTNKDGSQSLQTTSLLSESDKFPLKDPASTLNHLRNHRLGHAALYSALAVVTSVSSIDAFARISENQYQFLSFSEFTASIFALAAVTIKGVNDWQRTTAGINLLQSRIRERFVQDQIQTKSPN